MAQHKDRERLIDAAGTACSHLLALSTRLTVDGLPMAAAKVKKDRAELLEALDAVLSDPSTTCPPAPAEASLGPDELLVMAAETDGMRPPPDDEEDIGSMVFEP